VTPDPTRYPAQIGFQLPRGPLRRRVLRAAARLNLTVTGRDGATFVVTVPDPIKAYQLGVLVGPVRPGDVT
jgi:hypothetical protein